MPEALMLPAIHWGSVGPLLIVALSIMGSPGPATISLLAAGSAYGVRRSIPYLAGVTGGTAAVLVAVSTGVTAALLAIPAIGSALILVSAAYILWLAYRIATAPPLDKQTVAADAPSFAGGALLGVANPKAWVGIAAVFSSAHLADDPVTDAVAKIVVLTAVLIVTMPTWLVAGSSIAPMLREPRRARLVYVALAVVLLGATALTLGR